MKRTLSLFSHYRNWIPRFSDKILLLVKTKTFSLCVEAEKAFQGLKKEIENSVELECDASGRIKSI